MAMRLVRTALVAAFAFGLGFAFAHLPLTARAAATPLQPAAIDLMAMTPDSLPTPTALLPNLRSKTLVITDGMTVGIQMGTAAKHYHADANEVQVILNGTGTEWLGDHQVALKPGMMLIIPKGTNHAGMIATSGQLTFLAFKTPPQDPNDVHFVP